MKAFTLVNPSVCMLEFDKVEVTSTPVGISTVKIVNWTSFSHIFRI
jgi:hypothetical protein